MFCVKRIIFVLEINHEIVKLTSLLRDIPPLQTTQRHGLRPYLPAHGGKVLWKTLQRRYT